jgi:hypothetical protein
MARSALSWKACLTSLRRLALVGLWTIGPLGGVASAACPTPTSSESVASWLISAEAAYARLDVAGFHEGVDQAEALMRCLAEPMSKTTAAHLHRLGGLRAFANRDVVQARASFAAAQALDPAYHFPESLFPPGHVVLVTWEEARALTTTYESVPAPADGQVFLDGAPTLDRRKEAAVVLQVLHRSKEEPINSYIRPGEPLPAWTVAAQPPVSQHSPGSSPNRGHYIRGGVALGLSAGLFGLGAYTHQVYNEDPTPNSPRRNVMGGINHTAVIAGGAAGAWALTEGVLALTATRSW